MHRSNDSGGNTNAFVFALLALLKTYDPEDARDISEDTTDGRSGQVPEFCYFRDCEVLFCFDWLLILHREKSFIGFLSAVAEDGD